MNSKINLFFYGTSFCRPITYKILWEKNTRNTQKRLSLINRNKDIIGKSCIKFIAEINLRLQMNTANFENKASCIMYIFSLLNRLSTNHIKIDKYSFLSRYIQDFDFLGQKKSLRRLDGRGHFWTSI